MIEQPKSSSRCDSDRRGNQEVAKETSIFKKSRAESNDVIRCEARDRIDSGGLRAGTKPANNPVSTSTMTADATVDIGRASVRNHRFDQSLTLQAVRMATTPKTTIRMASPSTNRSTTRSSAPSHTYADLARPLVLARRDRVPSAAERQNSAPKTRVTRAGNRRAPGCLPDSDSVRSVKVDRRVG
jgi:hypothetical protein